MWPLIARDFPHPKKPDFRFGDLIKRSRPARRNQSRTQKNKQTVPSESVSHRTSIRVTTAHRGRSNVPLSNCHPSTSLARRPIPVVLTLHMPEERQKAHMMPPAGYRPQWSWCEVRRVLSQRRSMCMLGRARHGAARATPRQPGAAHAVVVAVGAAAAQRRSVSVA